MAEHAPAQYEVVEVKAEDLIHERRAFFNAFTTATTWAIGLTIVVLALMALFLV